MGEDMATMRRFVERFTISTPILREGDLRPVGPTLVLPGSPRRLRAAVHTFAVAFRRESRFDFVQFPDPDDRTDRAWEAWLWPASEARYLSVRSVAVGAACFRRVAWEELPEPAWTACWIWLHPYVRRLGMVSGAWPTFIDRYGDFILEPPLSDAMEGFAEALRLPRLGGTRTALPAGTDEHAPTSAPK